MKILIIKLGAAGDVLRTLAILPAMKEKYHASEIYWITKPESLEFFDGNPHIKKVFSLPYKPKEKFDILYNFDIEDEATTLAQNIKAEKKFGFYKQGGYPAAFNLSAEYYLNTLFDDELKKSNKKTYQQMMFEAAELPWKKQRYSLYLNEQDKKFALNFLKGNNLDGKNLVGIHIGASPRWPSKAWHDDRVIEFIEKASRKYKILLFGGPDEIAKHSEIARKLGKKGVKIYQNNPKSSKREFASLVDLCEKMVCCDSLALHVSLALGKKTTALFFCTSPDEVEGYGLLKKIISPLIARFFPEKSNQYSEELVKSISADEVLKSLE